MAVSCPKIDPYLNPIVGHQIRHSPSLRLSPLVMLLVVKAPSPKFAQHLLSIVGHQIGRKQSLRLTQ
jgi:hypothetical protein